MLYPSIVHCMESIAAEGCSLWSQDSITDSTTLLLAITITEPIRALVITNSCLQYLLSLTCSLQAEVKDVVDALTEVTHVTIASPVLTNNRRAHKKRCRDEIINDFLSRSRHFLVPILFHDVTSLHPPSFQKNDFSTCRNNLPIVVISIFSRNIGSILLMTAETR